MSCFQIKNCDDLMKAGKKLLAIAGTDNVLITRGSEGMALFNKKNPSNPFLLSAFNVSEVFDVTGAGDTVAGTISAAKHNTDACWIERRSGRC